MFPVLSQPVSAPDGCLWGLSPSRAHSGEGAQSSNDSPELRGQGGREGPGREGKGGRGGSSVEGVRSTHSRELKSLRCVFNIKKESEEKMATAWLST